MSPLKRLKAVMANGQGFTTKQVIGSDNPYLKSLVDDGKFTQDQVDAAWEKAKKIATKNAKANPNIVPSYAYTTAIFQDILGIKKAKTEARVVVKAAARLTAAYADEAQARKFLKSVTGVEVGKTEHSDPGSIRFKLADKQAFQTAKANLIKRYGPLDRSQVSVWSNGGSWFVDEAKTKVIHLSDTPYRGGMTPDMYAISVYDKGHLETPSQMIKRMTTRPTRPVPMK